MSGPKRAWGVRKRQAVVVGIACAASTLVVSPPFLLGALAVQIGRDLDLTPATLGLMSSMFFGVTAASSVLLGRIVQNRGLRASLTGVLITNISALVVVFSAPSLWWLALGMAIGGVANGAVHPAANAMLAQGVQGRLGLALGLKQAAMPASTLAAGLAVPLIALTVGWRVAFVIAALLSFTLLVVARRRGSDVVGVAATTSSSAPPMPFSGRVFAALIVGAALGATASSTLGAFLVDSGVRLSGVGEATTGLVLASAGTVGMVTRIGFGWYVDGRRDRTPYVTSIWMLLFGAVGLLLVATGRSWTYVLGALLAYGAGWGWQGLLHFAVITRSRVGAAQATGRLLTGFAGGSALGPLILGQVAERFGYALMWTVAALMAAGGALVIASMTKALTARPVA
jgi:predicted MFS family arabinose efflux permease